MTERMRYVQYRERATPGRELLELCGAVELGANLGVELRRRSASSGFHREKAIQSSSSLYRALTSAAFVGPLIF